MVPRLPFTTSVRFRQRRRRLRLAVFLAASLPVIMQAMAVSPQSGNGPDPSVALQKIRDKVAEISSNRSAAEVRAAVAAWKEREPNSPEPYIVLANYELSVSLQPTGIYDYATDGKQAPPPRPGSEEYSIVDPKTGKEVGIFGVGPTGPKPDAITVEKQQLRGAAELEAASKKFPNRLDIMIGRAIMLNKAHARNRLAAQMEMALQRAARDPQNLRWLEDQLPPRPAADEVLDALQGYIAEAFNDHAKSGDNRARDLAELGLKYFPAFVPLLSDLGSYYAFTEQWNKALTYYERAAKLAPEDSIVLGNIAQSQVKLGRVQDARAVAKTIIALNNDPEAVTLARAILEKPMEPQRTPSPQR